MKNLCLSMLMLMISLSVIGQEKVMDRIAPPSGYVRETCDGNSLSKELPSVPYSSLQPGDVFIKGGSPGHAVIVIDVAVHPATRKKVFLLAQSYMPAQQIHILVNPTSRNLSPWYELTESDAGKLYTPEWTFEKRDLKRFK